MTVFNKILLSVTCLCVLAFCLPIQAAESILIGDQEFMLVRESDARTYNLYTQESGKWAQHRFDEDVTHQPVISSSVVLFGLNGQNYRKLVAASPQGRWSTFLLEKPITGEVIPIVGNQVGAYRIGDQTIAYSGIVNRWDTIESAGTPYVHNDFVLSYTPDSYSVFSSQTGKWATIKNVNPKSHITTESLVVVFGKDAQSFHVFSQASGKWDSCSVPEGCSYQPVVSRNLVAMSIKGKEIRSLVASGADGKWRTLRLQQPVTDSASPVVSDHIVSYDLGDVVVGFSGSSGKWGVLKTSGRPSIQQSSIVIQEQETIAVFNGKTGRWSRTGP